MPESKVISFRCPDELLGAVEAYRDAVGRSLSAVIVEALRRLVDAGYQREVARQMIMDDSDDGGWVL